MTFYLKDNKTAPNTVESVTETITEEVNPPMEIKCRECEFKCSTREELLEHKRHAKAESRKNDALKESMENPPPTKELPESKDASNLEKIIASEEVLRI